MPIEPSKVEIESLAEVLACERDDQPSPTEREPDTKNILRCITHMSTHSHPTEITLSLKEEPYKSIMRAHFRLFGPDRFTGGRELEKLVVGKIMDSLAALEQNNSSSSNRSNGGVQFYRMSRCGEKREEVSERWAADSELCYLMSLLIGSFFVPLSLL